MKILLTLILSTWWTVANVPSPMQKVLVLAYRRLDRTPIARHVGDGDEEMKEIQRVHLTGSFTLKIQNDALIGLLSADFKETPTGRGKNNIDGTEFVVETSYMIYQPEVEWKIVKYRILYDKQETSFLDYRGRDWQQSEGIVNGPLTAIDWVGDTGSDQDEIQGCYIVSYLRRIEVTIEKKP